MQSFPMKLRCSKAFWMLWASLLFPSLLFTQGTDTALLRGTVTDASGAVVPNASVTMTNIATKVAEKRTTDQSGRYIFQDLKPASYTATVEVTGFKTLVRENIVLRVGQQSDLDLSLELGNMAQTVEVSAETPLLNTVSAALGTDISSQYISAMPLLDRDISSLSYLAAGVTEVANQI